MGGYGNGLFGPNDTISRAMMAQLLWNMEGKPVVNDAMSYTDAGVRRGHYERLWRRSVRAGRFHEP